MEWQKPLKDLSSRVFETMCFAVPEDSEDPDQSAHARSGYAVAFKSDDPNAAPCPSGVLWIGMLEECAMEMVSNMLGDPCPSQDELDDGVAELANVIVGQLFLECAPNSGHHLGTPVRMEKPSQETTLVEVVLEFDAGSASVVLAAA